MNNEYLILGGLAVVMGVVLLGPFLIKKVEEELEVFLFIMGIASVSISKLWSWLLVKEALITPIEISLAVLIAGLGFRLIRPKIKQWTHLAVGKLGYGAVFFILVAGLGLLSSVITAIIAALILAEVMSALKLVRNFEIKIVIIACFSIGLGAALTPLGEPLATIAVKALKDEPYHANFFFLIKLLGIWILPLVLGLATWAACYRNPAGGEPTLTEDKAENYVDVVLRAGKVYLFVMALVFLGKGFEPIVEKYVVNMLCPCPLLDEYRLGRIRQCDTDGGGNVAGYAARNYKRIAPRTSHCRRNADPRQYPQYHLCRQAVDKE